VKRFLRITAAAAVALIIAALGGSSAYGRPASGGGAAQGAAIKIGVLTSLTGPFTNWGIQTRAGMALAVNEINRQGGVKGRGQGRLLSLIVADDQSSPNAGIDGFRRLTTQDNVVAIGGLISSDVALATARLAEQSQVPIFLVKAGANEILTQNSRYTFRTCLPAAAEVAGPILQFAQRRRLTNVGAIVADYAWGQSIKSSLEAAFGRVSGISLKIEVAPVRETNFIPYLRSLGGVSLLVATGHPPGSGAILAQSGQLGLKVPVAGAYSPYSAVARAAGSAAYGRWGDFKCAATARQQYKDLARRYLRTFPQNQFFEDDALAGYAYVKVVAEAIRNVGTDRKRIAAYVHAHTFNIPGYAFPLKWTAWGELVGPRIQFAILTKGPPPGPGLNTAGDWWPRVLFSSQPLTPHRPS
jgi:branched-chain amino acid transport system substrate-binding protein